MTSIAVAGSWVGSGGTTQSQIKGAVLTVLNGPFSTYNLGWSVDLQQLPPGSSRSFLGGTSIEKLARWR